MQFRSVLNGLAQRGIRTLSIQDDRPHARPYRAGSARSNKSPHLAGHSATAVLVAGRHSLGLGQNLAVEEKEHAGEAENYRAFHDVTR